MLGLNNEKLGNSIPNFNLPWHTCGKYNTPMCRKYCYARRGHFMAAGVKKAFEERLKASKSDEFINIISSELKKLEERKGIKYLRLHSSGEFYDQEYYDKWNEIARRHPNVKFLVYTRNTDIDFSEREPNFKIYFSKDKTTRKINPTLNQTATIVEEHDHKHMFRHEFGTVCNSKCRKCKHCWNYDGDVVFMRH